MVEGQYAVPSRDLLGISEETEPELDDDVYVVPADFFENIFREELPIAVRYRIENERLLLNDDRGRSCFLTLPF